MVKEKQGIVKSVPEDPVMVLARVMKAGFDQSRADMQQLGLNDKKLNERIDAMEKNPPKKDIITQGIEVINALDKTGILEAIKGAISGGPEEPPISTNQIAPEGYDAYVKFTKSMQDMILDNQKESIRSIRLKNDQAEKAIGADF